MLPVAGASWRAISAHNVSARASRSSKTLPCCAARVAIVAAIEDALSPYDVRFAEMPLTPDRIVAALQGTGAYQPSP
jgi:hypothetical protein